MCRCTQVLADHFTYIAESDRKEFLRRKYSSNRMWAYLRAGNCRCKEKTAYCTAADVCTRQTDATQGNLIKHMGIGNF